MYTLSGCLEYDFFRGNERTQPPGLASAEVVALVKDRLSLSHSLSAHPSLRAAADNHFSSLRSP